MLRNFEKVFVVLFTVAFGFNNNNNRPTTTTQKILYLSYR
jgi:hypothetical protein